MKQKRLNNIEKYDTWFEKSFEDLVKKYPHKAIAVVHDEIVAVGSSEKEVDRIARKKYPGETPFVVTLPSEEDLICLLLLKSIRSIKSS